MRRYRFSGPKLTQLNLQDRNKAEEWSSLADAGSGEEYVPEQDPLFLEDINRLCNAGLKYMLQVDQLSDLLSTSLISPCICMKIQGIEMLPWRAM